MKFEVGSGIATLVPVAGQDNGDEMSLGDGGEPVALPTLRRMLADLDSDARLAKPVVGALAYAQPSISDDGHFGIELAGPHKRPERVYKLGERGARAYQSRAASRWVKRPYARFSRRRFLTSRLSWGLGVRRLPVDFATTRDARVSPDLIT